MTPSARVPEGGELPPVVPLRLDLLQVRASLAATGHLSAPYARRHGIDLAAIEVSAGIPVLAALRYQPDRSFDLDGGTPSIVIEAWADDFGDVLDLVAWPLEKPAKFARLYGRAVVLGGAALGSAGSDDGPLRVHRTPLSWLQAGCVGLVLLDPTRGILVLRDAPNRIAAEDDAHAAELAGLMVASLPLARIVVPEGRGAA